MSTQNGQCSCGATQFTVRGPALMRGYCHCTICQEFNQADFADITLFRAADVDMPAAEQLVTRCYKQPPMALRSKCKDCDKAAIEELRIPGLPKMVIVPTGNLADTVAIPDPALHIFYHSRVADKDDGLPKYSGFLRSQLAFAWRLIAALFKR
ncbi:MAG: GFA family protein [Oceanococcus sp.]